MLATDERSLPTAVAMSSCVRPNSSASRLYGEGLFDDVQVFALDVLDERPLEQLEVLALGHLAHGDRHREQARALGGAPAPLAGDDLVAAAFRVHDNRLDDAVRLDGPREVVDARVLGVRSRLVAVRREAVDVDLEGRAGRASRALEGVGDQRVESLPSA